jgi:CRISPR-associated protein Cmr6
MANAAVPNFVGNDFTDAAPGHRYNLYFPVWQADWSPDRNKTPATKKTTKIPDRVGDMLKALRQRQTALARQHGEAALTILAKSTAPFATGLGNEHPTENGFAFLTPYGLPYLAGSGVKGVLRRAAEELALFPEEYDLTPTSSAVETANPLPAGESRVRAEALDVSMSSSQAQGARALTPTHLPEGEGLSMLDVWWLFGFEGAAGAWWPLTRKEEKDLSDEVKASRRAWQERFDRHLHSLADRPDLPDFISRALPKGERADYITDPARFLGDLAKLRQNIHTRGALDFWDVFPDCKEMALEIMTPHYGDYYRGDSTPHDAGQPVPVTFLAIPAGSAFDFHVVCQPSRLPKHLQETWQDLLQAIFTQAFDWLGFGAKTSVGYGAMRPDEAAMQQLRERELAVQEQMAKEALQQAEDARLAELPAIEKEMVEVLRANQDPNVKDYLVLLNALKQQRWQGDDSRVVAERIRQLMAAAKIWKEKTEKKDPTKDKDHQRTQEVLKYLR